MEHPARASAILAATICILTAVAACSNAKPGETGGTGAAPPPSASGASTGATQATAPPPTEAGLLQTKRLPRCSNRGKAISTAW